MKRKAFGCIFVILFVATQYFFGGKFTDWRNLLFQACTILEAAVCLWCFIPGKKHSLAGNEPKQKRGKKVKIAAVLSFSAVMLTLAAGAFLLKGDRYYFIGILMILETLVPFAVMFEKRRPRARELVIISTLCAIAVGGRAAFYWLQQFKPVIAVVTVSAVCFGAETGFLVGAVSAFVSNFFFGQGPWTPWQMVAFGLIGLIAGVLYGKGILKKSRLSLSIYGAISAVVIYGGIMNPASVIIWQEKPNPAMLVASYVMGLPFDVIHAVSAVFFLWFISEPMIEKLDRVKNKYGIFM